MKTLKSSFPAFLLTALLAVSAMFAVAQMQFGGPPATSSAPAWKGMKLNPKTKVKLDFRNSSADMVLSFYEKVTGITFVKDPTLTAGLTISSAGPVSLSDALNILSVTLGLQGYDLTRQGDLLVVGKKPARPAFNFGAGGPGGAFGRNRQPKPVLRVYPVKYALASEIATVINQVYSPNPVSATPQPFGRFRFGQAPTAQTPAAGPTLPYVRASSEQYSNSVIVNAPSSEQDEVHTLIEDMDKQSQAPLHTEVFHLLYAVATDVQSEIQNVLSSNVPQGRGGATQQPQFGPAAFINALRGTTAGAGQVVADNRSNSLIVTATDDNLKTVGDVIKSIDHPTAVQSTTFVFTLQNARVDTVAELIQAAFGTRPGTNPNLNNLINSTGRINSTTGSSAPSVGGARPPTAVGGDIQSGPAVAMNQGQQPSQAPGGAYMTIPLEDPNATSGPLMTSVGVQGGLFFRGAASQFGQGGSQSGQPAYGYNRSGQAVLTQDLTGQITVIPDISTNSLIIVAPPEDRPIIEAVLADLDKVPEQVMIQTIIVEANLNKTDNLGVEWNFQSSLSKLLGDNTATGTGKTNFGLQSQTTPPQGLTYTIVGKELNAFLNAIHTSSVFQILSTPRIFTSNNAEAQINISQSIPYILSTLQGVNGNVTFNYAFENVGIVLDVTPRITSNGYVTMDVTQTANDLQGFTSFNAPIVNQREAQTTVSVKDGETLVLGGIIEKQVTATTNKVPLLGDIPILGNLFKSTSSSVQHTELLVLLTPHIVNDQKEADALLKKSEGELSPSTNKELQNVKNGNESGTPAGGKAPKGSEIKGSAGGKSGG